MSCGSLLTEPAPAVEPTALESRFKTRQTDLERFWRKEFRRRKWEFDAARLRLITQPETDENCNVITPGQCPCYVFSDRTIFADPSLQKLYMGPPNDNLINVMLAHEYGHHIQGLRDGHKRPQEDIVRRAGGDINAARSYLMKRLEMQADCLAGVYYHHLRQTGKVSQADVVEAGETLGLLAGLSGGSEKAVYPSYSERIEWFTRGADTGRIEECEPFDIPIFN